MPISQISDIDIRLLRIFHTVVSCGGLSAAELELNISCSTISRHLADLESRIGFKLCNRGAGGFSLTDEGSQVILASKQLLSAIRIFQEQVDEIHSSPSGELKIALFANCISNSNARLPETFRAFEKIAPAVKLNISIEPSNIIENGLIDHCFDIGIAPTNRNSTSLNTQPLYKEQMYLYCGKEHPLWPSDTQELNQDLIRQYKYAGLNFNSPNLVASNALGLECAALVQDQEALALLILSGQYLGFLPDHYAQQYCNKGQMHPICTKNLQYQSQFSIITKHTPTPGRKVQAFIECLLETHN